MNNTEKNITAYDLWSFVLAIQEAVKEGYTLSERNEHFPQGFVGFYTCTMIKQQVVDNATKVAEVAAVDTTKEVKPKGVRTKKAS